MCTGSVTISHHIDYSGHSFITIIFLVFSIITFYFNDSVTYFNSRFKVMFITVHVNYCNNCYHCKISSYVSAFCVYLAYCLHTARTKYYSNNGVLVNIGLVCILLGIQCPRKFYPNNGVIVNINFLKAFYTSPMEVNTIGMEI